MNHDPRESIIGRSSLLVIVPTFLSSIFNYSITMVLVSAYSSSSFILAVFMREVLCGIHILCMGSPFPIVHAKWSLVFWSVNNSY